MTTCPLHRQPALPLPDGGIDCPTGHTLSAVEAASVRQAQAIVGSIAAGTPVRRVLELWGER